MKQPENPILPSWGVPLHLFTVISLFKSLDRIALISQLLNLTEKPAGCKYFRYRSTLPSTPVKFHPREPKTAGTFLQVFLQFRAIPFSVTCRAWMWSVHKRIHGEMVPCILAPLPALLPSALVLNPQSISPYRPYCCIGMMFVFTMANGINGSHKRDQLAPHKCSEPPS